MKYLKAKNWDKFQHFKDRRPPWIKLYRDILDDYNYHCLPVESKAIAPLLWLMASESEISGTIQGDIKVISFRLRMSEGDALKAVMPLISGGFFDSDIGVISSCYQDDRPERETEAYSKEIEKKEELSAEKKSARPHSFILKIKAEDLSDDWLVKELSPPNVIEMWNEIIVGEENKKSHVYLTKDRRTKIQSRTKDSLPYGQHWLDYFQSIATDTFCMGEKGWKATIDWALKPASVIKMKEGGYSEKVR